MIATTCPSARTRARGCPTRTRPFRTSRTSCGASRRQCGIAARCRTGPRHWPHMHIPLRACTLLTRLCVSVLSTVCVLSAGAGRRRRVPTRAGRRRAEKRHHLLGRPPHQPRAAAAIGSRCAQPAQRDPARRREGRAPLGHGGLLRSPMGGRVQRVRLLQWRGRDLGTHGVLGVSVCVRAYAALCAHRLSRLCVSVRSNAVGYAVLPVARCSSSENTVCSDAHMRVVETQTSPDTPCTLAPSSRDVRWRPTRAAMR